MSGESLESNAYNTNKQLTTLPSSAIPISVLSNIQDKNQTGVRFLTKYSRRKKDQGQQLHRKRTAGVVDYCTCRKTDVSRVTCL